MLQPTVCFWSLSQPTAFDRLWYCCFSTHNSNLLRAAGVDYGPPYFVPFFSESVQVLVLVLHILIRRVLRLLIRSILLILICCTAVDDPTNAGCRPTCRQCSRSELPVLILLYLNTPVHDKTTTAAVLMWCYYYQYICIIVYVATHQLGRSYQQGASILSVSLLSHLSRVVWTWRKKYRKWGKQIEKRVCPVLLTICRTYPRG